VPSSGAKLGWGARVVKREMAEYHKKLKKYLKIKVKGI